MHYLSKEDYAKAAENGISKNVLYQRYYVHGWELEAAQTQPVERRNKSEAFTHWAKIAASNGIDYYTFRYRVQTARWNVIRAATKPARGVRKPVEREFYLTEDHFDIAKSNGITKDLAKSRVYVHGWSIKRAITQPHMSVIRSSPAVQRAINNGIKSATFWTRIRMGWSEERASTEPVHTGRGRKPKCRIDPDVLEIAEAYGISKHRLLQRLRDGWKLDDAATTPPIPIGERRIFGQAMKKEQKANAR